MCVIWLYESICMHDTRWFIVWWIPTGMLMVVPAEVISGTLPMTAPAFFHQFLIFLCSSSWLLPQGWIGSISLELVSHTSGLLWSCLPRWSHPWLSTPWQFSRSTSCLSQKVPLLGFGGRSSWVGPRWMLILRTWTNGIPWVWCSCQPPTLFVFFPTGKLCVTWCFLLFLTFLPCFIPKGSTWQEFQQLGPPGPTLLSVQVWTSLMAPPCELPTVCERSRMQQLDEDSAMTQRVWSEDMGKSNPIKDTYIYIYTSPYHHTHTHSQIYIYIYCEYNAGQVLPQACVNK